MRIILFGLMICWITGILFSCKKDDFHSKSIPPFDSCRFSCEQHYYKEWNNFQLALAKKEGIYNQYDTTHDIDINLDGIVDYRIYLHQRKGGWPGGTSHWAGMTALCPSSFFLKKNCEQLKKDHLIRQDMDWVSNYNFDYYQGGASGYMTCLNYHYKCDSVRYIAIKMDANKLGWIGVKMCGVKVILIDQYLNCTSDSIHAGVVY